MPRKDLVPVIELHSRFRRELSALNEKYPTVLGAYDKDGNECDEEIPVEKAYCNLLWQVDEEIRRLLKVK